MSYQSADAYRVGHGWDAVIAGLNAEAAPRKTQSNPATKTIGLGWDAIVTKLNREHDVGLSTVD